MKSNQNKSRFTLDMTPELRTLLKIAAARKSITMRQYCLAAVEQQLDREDVGVLVAGTFDREVVEKAETLQKSLFGKRRLSDASAELIRQAREERANQRCSHQNIWLSWQRGWEGPKIEPKSPSWWRRLK